MKGAPNKTQLKGCHLETILSPLLVTRYIDTKGTRTRYAVSGNGETILFLHGFPENLQTWRYYFPVLSKEFHVLACDLKGFGYSDKPRGDYSPWGMAEFVKDFIEVLEINNIYLVGTDIGLTVACAFALKYPDKIKKLILMAGTIYKEGIVAPEVRLLSIKPLGEFVLWFFRAAAIRMGLKKGFYNSNLVSEEIFNEYYRPFRDKVTRRRTLELIRSFDRTVPELAQRVKEISAPTLILWAQYERFFALDVAHRLHKDIKNSRLEVIPDCGHFIQEEKPQESAKTIISFLR